MEKINLILNNPEFINCLNKNQEHEINRIYCCHDEQHLLDVARVSYIINLEENLFLEKETIYAMGLLHDIGRWMEYEKGIDHAIASSTLAGEILKKCGFSKENIDEILKAIEGHRKNEDFSILGKLLYKADKLSRNCVSCKARSTCKRFQNHENPFLQY